jgi:hypothetical protein
MDRNLWSAAAVLALTSVASPALGQTQGSETVIHVVYHSYFDVLRPIVWAGAVDQEMTVVLSGKNGVKEEFSATAGAISKTWSYNAALGGTHWQVLGPNRLQRTISWPQNTRIDTIEVQGDHCRASWVAQLKPGFSEYQGLGIKSKQLAYFRDERMLSSTCEIHAR